VLNDNQVNNLIGGIKRAAEILLTYYRDPQLSISEKADLSPVTEADLASNQYITHFLAKEFPGIPVISEEGDKDDFNIRKDNEYSWILDPLDGTKEFIAQNDEFAINLALLHRDRPIFGIIAIPAKDLIYYAVKGKGSWKLNPNGLLQRLPLHHSDYRKTKKIVALISRSHSGDREKEFINQLKIRGWSMEIRPTGSSYKHVLLAEGVGHIYAKPGICWEWDTAPGQIILEEAGGSVVRLDNGEPLVYNKEYFSNPDLIMWAPGVFIPLQ
jgi:3'(2'), 5'-bisphosphate nucleotidase